MWASLEGARGYRAGERGRKAEVTLAARNAIDVGHQWQRPFSIENIHRGFGARRQAGAKLGGLAFEASDCSLRSQQGPERLSRLCRAGSR